MRNSILVDVQHILRCCDRHEDESGRQEGNRQQRVGATLRDLKQEWNAGNLLHGKAGEQLMELDHLAQCRLRLRSNEDKTLSANRLAGSIYGIVIKGT